MYSFESCVHVVFKTHHTFISNLIKSGVVAEKTLVPYLRIILNPCSCSREVCIYSCTPSIQLLFHPSGCRMKLHKECAGAGQGLAPCKVSYDPTTAKEMLLMATSLEEQQFWTGRLLKKIQKGGYKAAGQVNTSDISGIRGYIQE